MKTKLLKIAGAVVLCLTVGGLSSLATMDAIDGWYATIQKPAFTPPNAVFGPAWTVLYIMMGVAAGLVWSEGWDNPKVRMALNLFIVQLLLNGLWSVIFFYWQSPLPALFEIVALWALIAVCIWQFRRINKVAAWLMVPYLLWVSFATVLNGAIWWLNY